MKAKILLRMAAALILIHLMGHSLGHSAWDKPEDPKMKEVVASMKGYSTEFMGTTKSMADYYNGYSLIIFGLYGMTILILWFTSGFINEQRTIAAKILWPIGITYVAFGIIEYIAFFPFAAAMSLFAGLLILVSVTLTKN
jgi:hypothetical protein